MKQGPKDHFQGFAQLNENRSAGFISIIISLVIALALLKYFFDWNVLDFIKSPDVTEVWDYIKRFVLLIWTNIIKEPFLYIWNEIIVGVIWHAITAGFDILKGWVDSQN